MNNGQSNPNPSSPNPVPNKVKLPPGPANPAIKSWGEGEKGSKKLEK